MCCRSNFNNVWASLPCCFPKDPLKLDLLEIDLTMFFGVRNFGNTPAMRVIFFFQLFIAVKVVDLQKVSVSDMQDLKTIS